MLIANGHTSNDVMNYTPKQIQTFLYFVQIRKKKEAADLLSLHSLAARGEPKDVKKTHQELMKE